MKETNVNFLPPKEKKQKADSGHLFIISAPSGAGKTTLCKAVLKVFSDMVYSISHTTRKPRPGEQHGVDYFFVSKDDFIAKIKSRKWAEWAEIYDNYYGTCGDFIDAKLRGGCDILLDIDAQGAEQILRRYPDSVTVFIMPPSLEALKARLEARGTDNQAEIAKRLRCAEKEMAQKSLYRHIIVNDRLEKAIDDLIAVMKQYR